MAINLPDSYDNSNIEISSIMINGQYKPLISIENKNIKFNFEQDELYNNKFNRFKSLSDLESTINNSYENGKCLIDIDSDGKKELVAVFVVPDIAQMDVKMNYYSFSRS